MLSLWFRLSGKTTDRLIAEEKEITENASPREHDVLVSVGEQITIAKLAMVLQEKGYKAVSQTGWQVPIVTNSDFKNGRIRYINNDAIRDLLQSGNIVIIAGFQGVDENLNITTLGRGGSDTTAVALAASLNAERCDIFTDVDGVYVVDPKIIENPKKIDNISYDEMLEMASLGAKVLHNRCVEIGKKYNVPIYVKSTFEKINKGSVVSSQKSIEYLVINGIAKEDNISRITVIGLENKIGKTYELFDILAKNDINVDIILQAFGETFAKNITFSVKSSDLNKALRVLEENKENLNYHDITHNENLSKVSIIGVGIANKPGVAVQMFEALYEKNINMHMVTTSEIKISVLVDIEEANNAVSAIYRKFF